MVAKASVCNKQEWLPLTCALFRLMCPGSTTCKGLNLLQVHKKHWHLLIFYARLHLNSQRVTFHIHWNSAFVHIPTNKTQRFKHSHWELQTLWPVACLKFAFGWWRQGLLKRNNSTKNNRGIILYLEVYGFHHCPFQLQRLWLKMNDVNRFLVQEKQRMW